MVFGLEQPYFHLLCHSPTKSRNARIVVSLFLFLVANKRSFAYNQCAMIHPTPIDITNMPELVKIAEEVDATKTPRELIRENKPVALITPVTGAKKAKKQKAKTKADYEAFKSAAGGWKDIDTDKLIANIYASRRRSNRPPVEL